MRIEPPTDAVLTEAAAAINRGELVVLPTETVYGLGCNALDANAVKAVFKAKGRPAENPLIVHIPAFEDLGMVARGWPEICEKLAERYWPGPLTMVLPKRPIVPHETTAGLDTVAVRVPDHRVALELIRRAKVPIAAPSANPFMSLSPTSVDDIEPEIGDAVAMVIDGGQCVVGLESTVLDLSGEQPRILRPGGVTRAQIQAVLGEPLGDQPITNVHRSPGMYPRHYAPKSKLVVVERLDGSMTGLTFESPSSGLQIKMPSDSKAYASSLYRALKRLDLSSPGTIYVESPPNGVEWEAVHDRLKKAMGTSVP